jgi:hypothetical protein
MAVALVSQGPAQAASPQPQQSGEATSGVALSIYAELTHRTVLRPAMLPRLSESVISGVLSDTNAVLAALESEFARKDIEVVRDGELFVRLVPKSLMSPALTRELARIKAPPPGTNQAAESQLPPGLLDFRGADLGQVLMIYPHLAQRMVLRPRVLSGSQVWLRTQTPMSHDEALYALKVVLALNGVALVEDGDRFVQAVPLAEADRVKTQSPKREPNEPLIKPQEAPALPAQTMSFPLRLPPGATNTSGPLRPPPARVSKPDLDELVAYYAKLTGRKAEPSPALLPWLPFRASLPLTKPEMVYAIETTLALNGLRIVPGEDGGIRAGKL